MEKSYKKCLDSIEKIDPGRDGYVDLFLIHSPNVGEKARKEMWAALEKLLEKGKAKSIGVSNFGVGHLEEMKSYAKVWPPQVNQIEVSTYHHINASCKRDRSSHLDTGPILNAMELTASASSILGVNNELLQSTARTTA